VNKKRIVIVGGGLSGTLVALELVRRGGDQEIILVEKSPQMIGRGVAYNYDFTHQPLNVTAAGMSLFANDPEHFYRWISNNRFRYSNLLQECTLKTFVPRKIFGDYVVEHLQTAHNDHASQLQIRIDEVTTISESAQGLEAHLESGIVLNADHIILALGNFPPADIFPDQPEITQSQAYFPNPWTDKVYSNLNGNENILLVGTGLTAVDVVLGLRVRNFKGKITMLSRRGKLPLPHDLSHAAVELRDPGYLNPRDTFFWLLNEIRNRKETPWPAVIEGIRPFTQEIWKRWSNEEKRYFMKRIRPIWEVIRHRIPVQSSFVLTEMISSGQLTIHKGQVQHAKLAGEQIEISWESDRKTATNSFSKVVNCTGPESNYRKVRLPVLTDLMNKKMLVNDELGLGIACTYDGKLIGENGKTVQGLWCIGPMRKAVLWETTAIRELRIQASEIASEISSGN
jgi:uncharacterized NAD(P)/FAD-binding protein YdhS